MLARERTAHIMVLLPLPIHRDPTCTYHGVKNPLSYGHLIDIMDTFHDPTETSTSVSEIRSPHYSDLPTVRSHLCRKLRHLHAKPFLSMLLLFSLVNLQKGGLVIDETGINIEVNLQGTTPPT